MSCGCGGSGRPQAPVVVQRVGGAMMSRSAPRPAQAVFRYEGDRPIVVIGRVTGTKYRFEARGAEVAVDLRDRASVLQVPRLREMRPA